MSAIENKTLQLTLSLLSFLFFFHGKKKEKEERKKKKSAVVIMKLQKATIMNMHYLTIK